MFWEFDKNLFWREDVSALKTEIDHLRTSKIAMNDQASRLLTENAVLRSEIERLKESMAQLSMQALRPQPSHTVPDTIISSYATEKAKLHWEFSKLRDRMVDDLKKNGTSSKVIENEGKGYFSPPRLLSTHNAFPSALPQQNSHQYAGTAANKQTSFASPTSPRTKIPAASSSNIVAQLQPPQLNVSPLRRFSPSNQGIFLANQRSTAINTVHAANPTIREVEKQKPIIRSISPVLSRSNDKSHAKIQILKKPLN